MSSPSKTPLEFGFVVLTGGNPSEKQQECVILLDMFLKWELCEGCAVLPALPASKAEAVECRKKQGTCYR